MQRVSDGELSGTIARPAFGQDWKRRVRCVEQRVITQRTGGAGLVDVDSFCPECFNYAVRGDAVALLGVVEHG